MFSLSAEAQDRRLVLTADTMIAKRLGYRVSSGIYWGLDGQPRVMVERTWPRFGRKAQTITTKPKPDLVFAKERPVIWFTVDTSGQYHFTERFKQALDKWAVDSWREYKAECRADSTERCFGWYVYHEGEEGFVPCEHLGIDPGMDSAFRGTLNRWIHRDPTFEGFMDWLERKTK